MMLSQGQIGFLIQVALLSSGWTCFLRSLGATRQIQRRTYGALTCVHVAAGLAINLGPYL